MTREEILMNAKKCVCGDREEDYGSPENNFATIADLWNVYVHALAVAENANDIFCPLFTAEDVAMMMALLKIARIANGRTKEDSFIDLAGYAACAGEIAAKKIDGLSISGNQKTDNFAPTMDAYMAYKQNKDRSPIDKLNAVLERQEMDHD